METKDQYSASTLKKLILDTIKNEMLIEPDVRSGLLVSQTEPPGSQ